MSFVAATSCFSQILDLEWYRFIYEFFQLLGSPGIANIAQASAAFNKIISVVYTTVSTVLRVLRSRGICISGVSAQSSFE